MTGFLWSGSLLGMLVTARREVRRHAEGKRSEETSPDGAEHLVHEQREQYCCLGSSVPLGKAFTAHSTVFYLYFFLLQLLRNHLKLRIARCSNCSYDMM